MADITIRGKTRVQELFSIWSKKCFDGHDQMSDPVVLEVAMTTRV
jgi:hypothetical protein